MIELRVRKESIIASTPTFAHNDSNNAGADIYAAQNKIIWPKSKAIINTFISLEPILKPDYPVKTPDWFKKFYEKNYKTALLIKSRSGLSAFYSLEHGAGVIDSGYRGEIKIILYNHGWLPYRITTGDRVAQIITMLLPQVDIVKSQYLNNSNRGEKGFGSSGTD